MDFVLKIYYYGKEEIMKVKLTTGEKIKDLRNKAKLTSEELCKDIERKFGYVITKSKYNEI